MSRFRAAAGRFDIHSPPGLKMAGFGARLEGAASCHDALIARALWVEAGDGRALLWIACDLIGLGSDVDALLRERIARACGLKPAAVFISCSHTHGSMNSMTFRGPLGAPDAQWLATLGDQLVALAISLPQMAEPVTVAVGHATVPGLGYNRQDASAPVDDELTVVRFIRGDGRCLATMLNYALHPVVLGERNLLYTADFPGAATTAVEEEAGGFALWVQGACGDIEPAHYRDEGRNTGTFALAIEMGQTIARAAAATVEKAESSYDVSFAVAERFVELPLDEAPSKAELASLRAEFAAARGPRELPPNTDEQKWAEFEIQWADELADALSRGEVRSTQRLRLAAARVGSVRFIAIPAEIYAEIGLALKAELASRPLIVAAYTGGLVGYVATDRAKRQGGYGPARSFRFFSEQLTAFGYGSAALLTSEAATLVRSLDQPSGNGPVSNKPDTPTREDGDLNADSRLACGYRTVRAVVGGRPLLLR